MLQAKLFKKQDAFSSKITVPPSPFSRSRFRKIILGDQQITLLCDTRRIAKPRADHVQRELALQFCLSAGSPLLKLHCMEQSWPTRDSCAAQ